MSILALVLFGGWTLLLLVAIASLRTYYTLSGRWRVNRFAPAGDDVSAFSGRLCRAHANCYENLPVFTAIIVAAHLSGHSALTDPLALVVVGARIAQSSVHILSTRARAVLVRFAFFAVQVAIIAYWTTSLASLMV